MELDKINRRDFLKIAGISAAALAIPKIPSFLPEQVPTLHGENYLFSELGKIGVTNAEIIPNLRAFSYVLRGLFDGKDGKKKYFACTIHKEIIMKDKRMMDKFVGDISNMITTAGV